MASVQDLLSAFAPAQSNLIGYTQKAITAAGTTSSDATVCTTDKFFILTATGADGIRMNASAPLLTPIVVANTSGSNGKVYPTVGGAVNGGSTDAGETVGTTTVQIWFRVSTNVWVAVLGA